MRPPDNKNAPGANQEALENIQKNSVLNSPKTQAKSSLEQALLLAGSGVPVFPCYPDKTPACVHGCKDATDDPDAVRMLWGSRRKLLVAIATGAMSGIDGLDIDPRHGGDAWLDANSPRLPHTQIHETRSGGQHWLFRHRPGLRCSTSKLAPGVDIRADGGSLIWWPASGLPVVSDMPIADWPEWIIAALMPPKPAYTPAPVIIPGNDKYAAAALRHAADAVACAPEGCRNATLNREAWSLLRLVDSGALTIQAIVCGLADAAMTAGLSQKEITATLASAIRSRRGTL